MELKINIRSNERPNTNNNNNSNEVTNPADKRFKTLPATETLPRNKFLGGYIFVCNNDTMQEDLKGQLFGNYCYRLFCIRWVVSFGGSDIDPTAWEDKKCQGESRFSPQSGFTKDTSSGGVKFMRPAKEASMASAVSEESSNGNQSFHPGKLEKQLKRPCRQRISSANITDAGTSSSQSCRHNGQTPTASTLHGKLPVSADGSITVCSNTAWSAGEACLAGLQE
ncbi:hypothetical protein SAY86_009384 [Trapa natans]|uniref:DCD domain-containing protein n=1 Tax=Trapa natans TaxID=22666 RepID=A0AAN7KZM5_TRANT|nr:hypothetical protein SAY86_009384 [Trapa natans]